MFNRDITPLLQKTVSTFPITTLIGPRQSGKTTLLKSEFPEFFYINLEYPDELALVREDPRNILRTYADKGIIFDEVQKYPELFSYIQAYSDDFPKSKFILSGSQNILLSKNISQSLAGRSAILELLPLCYHEYLSHPNMPEVFLAWDWLYHGTYPRPYQEKINTKLWYQSYITTYLERDVRDLLQVRELSRFQRFIKLCAGRHGQLLNLHQLAIDADISHTMAKHWLSVLEASYVIFLLQPYFVNFNKRLVKTPKLYFYDSAIVCQLLGIESPEHLSLHSNRGAIFEGFVISELLKYSYNRGVSPNVYFWRDNHGLEVDCLLEYAGKIFPIEIKAAMTFREDLLRGIQKFAKISEIPFAQCKLIYAGNKNIIMNNIAIIPWNEILKDIHLI